VCYWKNLLAQSGCRAYKSPKEVTQSLEVNKSKQNILVLDGLRAIACLSVMFYHLNSISRRYAIWNPSHGIYNILNPLWYCGDSAVILFFILSAFLLFLPFVRSILFDTAWPSVSRFYVRRIFRILPAYYIALVMVVLFFHPEFLRSSARQSLWTFFTFRMGFILSQQLNGTFWTLAIEFQFYLLLPLIAWVCGLIVRRGSLHWRMLKLTACLVCLVAWGELTRYWGVYLADTTRLYFMLPQTIAAHLKAYIYGDTGKYTEVFAIGMLLSIVYTYTFYADSSVRLKKMLNSLSPWLFIIGLFLLYTISVIHFYWLNIDPVLQVNVSRTYTFFDPYMSYIIFYWKMFSALGYAISYGLCMCAVLYGARWFQRIFEWCLFRWIGLISFSLYIWHLPIMLLYANSVGVHLVQQGFRHSIEYVVFYWWVLVIILPLALAWYRWIEVPGVRLGEFLFQFLSRRGK
jgi:peptidoglycan/LPS O-acetylase OafA/YrhL